MLKLIVFVKKSLPLEKKVKMINQWEEWRGASESEYIFDLANDKDCECFMRYYGAQTLSRCRYTAHRFWMGGDNFYDNVENKSLGCSAQIYAITDDVASDIIRKVVIPELEDGLKPFIQDYGNDIKSAIEHISSCFDYLIDFHTYIKQIYPHYNNVISIYGRRWEIKENNPVTEDEKWWYVSTFSDGKLYMNNVDGEMVLIENNGRILYTHI